MTHCENTIRIFVQTSQ